MKLNQRLKKHFGIREKSAGKVQGSILAYRLAVWLLFVFAGNAADMAQRSAETMTIQEIKASAEAVAETFASKYILHDEGQRIADVIRERMKKGTYDDLCRGRDLAAQLQKDAKSVNEDPHIRITFAPEEIASMKDPERQKIAREEAVRRARAIHHGFEEIRILPGHVGYLKLNRFMGSLEAFETAESAMCFLAGCPAVIVDLRWNPGGESSMVQFLCSYFFSEEPQLLDVFHFRENNRIEQLWTLPYVPGQRFEHADLYILTSGLTFSAAEGMAYDLQALDRAVIVGFFWLAIGIFTGAVWAEQAWGRYWSWDPKETWALITWLVYALYLHLRRARGWHGRRLALVSVIGFVAVLFTWWGVSYLMSGLHAYV